MPADLRGKRDLTELRSQIFAPMLDNMNPPPALTGAHLRTYQTIFQHPVSHNLGWHEVHALFRQLGQVEEEPNGNLKVTRNGQTLVLPPTRTKDVAETDELMKIRDFLERSEKTRPEANEQEARWLVVISHHEARIFRSEIHGTVAEQIRPHQTDDAISHAHSFDGFSRGQEKPASHSFFGPVADALKEAGQILIFGSGTGTADEMDQFVAWLKIHHPELARRITGALIIDAHHLTDAQLLAKARDSYARTPRSAARFGLKGDTQG